MFDDYIGDFYFHGVWDDTEEGKRAMYRVANQGIGYKVIRGELIDDRMFEDEEDERNAFDYPYEEDLYQDYYPN